MTTAFLGPRGSFSEEAALMRASADDLLPVVSFPAAVAAVKRLAQYHKWKTQGGSS